VIVGSDLSAAFGDDAVEIRRRNLIDRFPYKTATGLKPTTRAPTRRPWKARSRLEEARRHGRYLGIGLATFTERTGFGTSAFAAHGLEITVGFETVEVAMDPSGHVEARIGTSPHGQGLRTTQIIADQLGLTPDRIRITHGDTDATPYGFGTFGSRSLVLSGGASLLAAGKLRRKLLAIAGRLLETAAGRQPERPAIPSALTSASVPRHYAQRWQSLSSAPLVL
jgi:aerobic carbon-monoxide dehydrogenase large subunit